MNNISLGQRIRESRKEKGLTQEQLAEMADIGVIYLSEIERGKKMPSLKILCRIIDVLDVSSDYLLRDLINAGREYIIDDVTMILSELSPRQRKTAVEILNAFFQGCKNDV